MSKIQSVEDAVTVVKTNASRCDELSYEEFLYMVLQRVSQELNKCRSLKNAKWAELKAISKASLAHVDFKKLNS